MASDSRRRAQVDQLLDEAELAAGEVADQILSLAAVADEERGEMLATAAEAIGGSAEELEASADLSSQITATLSEAEEALDHAGELITKQAAKVGAKAEAERLRRLRRRVSNLRDQL
jgi:hypothetical protein